MAWMVWGQGTGVGSGHWLLSGSPRQLFPAMDGGLVPLPGSPRWLLLSSWWQEAAGPGTVTRCWQGCVCRGAGAPPDCKKESGGREPRLQPQGRQAPRLQLPGKIPAPSPGGGGEGTAPRQLLVAKGLWVAVEPCMAVSRLGQGYQGSPDDTLRGFPGKEGAQPSPVIPALS